ncbi:MAG TPA: hypothetical protein VFG76_02235 [Candidatus Polarisedimenticolia bacterium]|nr:hypothetical protein [Candidatus Polarisedimenticolia bacterium]
MFLSYICRSCGTSNRLTPPFSDTTPACRRCAAGTSLAAAGDVDPLRPPARCVVCGDDKLFTQKSFNTTAGCLVVAAGAAAVPWTYGLSLALCALIDYLLYRRLPPITVCYVCGARYHGQPVNPNHGPYDLMTAQTYEARSIRWRQARD